MKQFCMVVVLFITQLTLAQEEEKVRECLLNYIEGTSYNKTTLIDKSFEKDADLFLTKSNDDLWKVSASEYSSWFSKSIEGSFNGRIGNILSIDIFGSIATAKVEIRLPAKEIIYIDMFLLKKINKEWKIISKSADSKAEKVTKNRILFIVSNAHYYGGTNLPTGNSYSEIVNAYHTFKKAGYMVDFVSPKGGSIPLAYINTSDLLQKHYLYDADFMYAIKNTKQPSKIMAKDYKAVHYIGGGSAMFGVPENEAIQKLVMSIYEEYGGIISSVCHGTAGIVHLKTKDGKYLVDGKTVNGYPDAYEREGADYFNTFPFLITKTIEERGGIFKYSPRNSVHVEEDGNLITGQNYLSSEHVAKRIIDKLNKQDN